MSQKGIQDTSISLAIISQGIIEIAKELAILNDYGYLTLNVVLDNHATSL